MSELPEATPAPAVSAPTRRQRLARLLLHPALIYLAVGVLSRAGSFLLVPLYTRRLSVPEYSVYASFTTVHGLLVTLYTLGLQSSITRSFYSPREGVTPEQSVGDIGRGILAAAVALASVGSVLVAALVPGRAMLMSPYEWYLLLWASVGVAMASTLEVYLMVAQRPWGVAALQLSSFALSLAFGLLFVVGLGRGGQGAIESVSLAAAVQGSIALGYFLWRLPPSAAPARTVRQELKLSLPHIPHSLALWAQQAGDRAILSGQARADQLGLYHLAVQLTSPLNMVVSAWNNGRVPLLGEAYRDRGDDAAARLLPSQYAQYGGVTLVPAVALVLASPLLPLVVGPRFDGAVGLLPPLLLSIVVESLYFPSANYLMIAGHSRLIPVATGLSSALSLAMVLVLLPRFGLAGLLGARVIGAGARAGSVGLLVLWYRRRARPPVTG